MGNLVEFGTFSASGQLDATGDTDLFKLELLPGRQYTVSATSTMGGVALDVFDFEDPHPLTKGQETFQLLQGGEALAFPPRSSTFVAESGVDYFVRIYSAYNSFQGPDLYEITVIETEDDALAGTTTSAELALNGTFEGSFETSGDQDWVRLDVTDGLDYLLTSNVAASSVLFLLAYDADTGAQMGPPLPGAGTTFGASPQIGFSAQDGVEYYAVLQGGVSFGAVDYTLSLSSIAGDAANNETTSLEVDPGGTVQSLFQARGDYDWIKLNTTAGESYQVGFSFVAQFGGNGAYNLIELDNATGLVTEVDELVGERVFSARPDKTYFVEPVPSEGAAQNGLYEVSLTALADELPDNETTTGLLTTSEPYTLEFQEALFDIDVIRLDVEGDKRYEISSNGSYFVVVREDQLDLAPLEPLVIEFGDNFADPRVDFGAYLFGDTDVTAVLDTEEGFDYFIYAQPNRTFGGSTPPVSFDMQEVTTFDTADNASTTASISLNQTLAGVFESRSDQDWILLDLEAGEQGVLDVTSGGNVHLFAVDGAGTVQYLEKQSILSNGGFFSTTLVSGRENEDLYVQVGALQTTGFLPGMVAQNGTYSISFTPVSDDVTDDPADAPLLGFTQAVDTTGTTANDVVHGTDADETLTGLNGNDVLVAFGGDDDVFGGAGRDDLSGGLGDDLLQGGFGNDTIDGGAGVDLVSYIDAIGSITVDLKWDLSRGADGRDTLTGLEGVVGSDFGDRIAGDLGANVFQGGDGADIIKGRGGADQFYGGLGDDRMIGGLDDDMMFGGAGVDILIGLNGDDQLYGGADGDFIYGGQDGDSAAGGDGDDKVLGNRGNDTLWGDSGRDDLRGGGNNDQLYGGADDDFLFGERGADTLDGGAGNDVLTGGIGGGVLDGARDVFVYASGADGSGGFDRVKDFEDGLDRIDLTAFGFTDFATHVDVLSSDRTGGLRLDFGSGDVLFIEGFETVFFDASDVILV